MSVAEATRFDILKKLATAAMSQISRSLKPARRKAARSHTSSRAEEDAAGAGLEELLPAAESGPEAAVMRAILLAEIEAALAELPPEQREVFIAQELDGVTFRELAQRSGVSINTLLSRKRYAVRYLRERLQAAWDEWLTR